MVENRPRRRLAAILAADVVGFSRLMQLDEAATLAALKARRSGVLEPALANHRGRIVKVMGDGVLVEFASAVDAVECGVQLQKTMAIANASVPEDRRIVLRVGINLGDVMVEGGDLYGDGVNIAARLEALAEPGGVWISATVFNHVRGKVSLDFEDLGEKSLKNMAGPVKVYRARRDDEVAAPRPAATPSDKPSIAVLPFTNMSDDPDQGYFSDGVTEDIITELSRFRSLFVIARHSSFQYRGNDVDVRRVGRELNVDYVIEGSIRRSGDRLRITAQLIDATTGKHIWAERYDRDTRDIFAVQDEMAQSIAGTAGGRAEESRRQRAVRADAAGLQAYDLCLRAKAVNWMYSKEANRQAHAWAEKAIELDPTSAPAHAWYSLTSFMRYVGHWATDSDAALHEAHQFARTAIELDNSDVEARGALGHALLAMHRFEESGIHFEKAVELNPNNSEARCWLGMHLCCIGKHEAALEQFDLAKLRNPFDLAWMPWLKGVACFSARRYAEAIACFNQIVDPIYEIRGWQAASYALAGQLAESRMMLDDFLRGAARNMVSSPSPTLKGWEPYWRKVIWYKDERDFDHLFEGLRRAGLPERREI